MPPTSTVQKLRIREGMILKTLNPPPGFKKDLGPLPSGVKITEDADRFDQVHWFVKDRKQMEKELSAVLKWIKGPVLGWIYFPKGSSGIQTDLNRDKGWEELIKHELQYVNLISFNDTWSAFGIREKSEADRKKEEKPRERPIFDYVDPQTKTVKLPADLAAAFRKHKKEESYFNALAFSHKKEYIEWIVTAKRDETRMKRISGTIEMLKKGWKNPANR